MFNDNICVCMYTSVYVYCLASLTYLSVCICRINYICEKDKPSIDLFFFLKSCVECAFWLFSVYIMYKIIKAPSRPDSSGLWWIGFYVGLSYDISKLNYIYGSCRVLLHYQSLSAEFVYFVRSGRRQSIWNWIPLVLNMMFFLKKEAIHLTSPDCSSKVPEPLKGNLRPVLYLRFYYSIYWNQCVQKSLEMS